MLAYLRVKIKSLAAEAVIIRRDEERLKWRWDGDAVYKAPSQLEDGTWTSVSLPGAYVKRKRSPRQEQVFWGLRVHRTVDIRREQRSSLLAYAFLRRKKYLSVEQRNRPDTEPVDLERVTAIALKFGTVERLGNIKSHAVLRDHVSAWLAEK